MTFRNLIPALARARATVHRRVPAIGEPTERPQSSVVDRWMARWGRSGPNRLADRAGRYRRLAIVAAFLPAPFIVRGIFSLSATSLSARYGVAYLVLAGCCLWLAVDLIRSGSLIGANRAVSGSAVAVALATVAVCWLEAGVYQAAAGWYPTPGVVGVGLVGVIAALGVMLASERWQDPMLGLAGRWLLVVGALGLGSVEWVRAVRGVDLGLAHAICSGVVATILFLAAIFECKVLLRGLALMRLPARW